MEKVSGRSIRPRRTGKAGIDEKAQLRQLEQQLAAAEATIESLLADKGDALVEPNSATPLLLRQVQEATLKIKSERTLHAAREREAVLLQLRERIKELTLLHQVGQLLHMPNLAVPDLLQSIVNFIPAAWSHSDIASARICYGDTTAATANFCETPWMQRSTFTVSGEHHGVVEVSYAEERPDAGEGPFLKEERAALDALTGMLHVDLERRQAAEALQRSEARYRTLFETMAEGVIYQDAEGNVIDINPAAERMLGIGRGEATSEAANGDDLYLVREDGSPLPPEERPGRRAVLSGEPVYGQVIGIYLQEPNRYRWMAVNSIPQFRPGDQTPHRVYSTLTDITDRKRAEERRAQLAALVESSQDAIVGIDMQGTITSWNRGAEEVFGYSSDEAVGRHFKLIAPREYWAEQRAAAEKIRRGETVENYNTVRLRKDGQRIFVSFSISPILDATGKTVGVSGIARNITEQKRAEARLRFQAQLLDSVNEAVVACDMQNRIIYWGNGAAALYGYSREEAVGRLLTDLNLLPEYLSEEDVQQQRREVFEKGAWRGEVQQRCKDGSRLWVRISLSAVRDMHGQPVGFVGIDRDVSAERQHERELEVVAAVAEALRLADTGDSLYDALFDELKEQLHVKAVVILLSDVDGERLRIPYVAGMHEEYRGRVVDGADGITHRVIATRRPYRSDDVSRESFYKGPPVPAASAAVCMPLVASKAALGAMWLLRENAFDDADMRLLASVTDMVGSAVQRSFYFERLHEQALQVQRIVDTVEDGLVLMDRERRVLLANPSGVEHLAALEAFGSGDSGDDEGAALVGRRVLRMGERPVQALLGAPGGTEQTVITSREPRREFRVAAHPVVEDGAESGWVLVLHDVTEARRTEELVQQQERLAAVGQLAAGIAHDFNNVMSAIVLYAQILQRRDDLSEKERRRLDVIYRQANHAIELIKQILDFSRRSVMERSALDLVPFFKEMFRLFEHTLPENINLLLHYDHAEYFVMADPTRLQQALTNLAINARDAMPDGGTFTVHMSRLHLAKQEAPPAPEMSPGAWLQLAVSDDGTGMPREILQHVFEPFYTTKAPGKGTGLGLAQVYGIVRQHDGYIVVESAEGQGATFTIYLPLLEQDKSHTEAPIPDFGDAATAAEAATILVVEDEEWTRVAVEEALQALGYRVLTAGDGQAALDVFTERGAEIDLVLSDMVMPEMGGLKLQEKIRADHPQVKMMIMSGYPLEDGGRELMEQGGVAWIHKPFSVNDLAEKVAGLLA